MSGRILVAIVTVQITIIASRVTPMTNAATQISTSGSSIASDSDEIDMTAPLSTTNKTGRRGLHRSATSPPTMSPIASDAEIRPQAAGPPRCAFATSGPSTWNVPYQAARITVNWNTVAHSQVCDQNSDQPSR